MDGRPYDVGRPLDGAAVGAVGRTRLLALRELQGAHLIRSVRANPRSAQGRRSADQPTAARCVLLAHRRQPAAHRHQLFAGGRHRDHARSADGTLAVHPRPHLPLCRDSASDPGGRVDSAGHPALADRGRLDHLHHLPRRVVPDHSEHPSRRGADAGSARSRGAVARCLAHVHLPPRRLAWSATEHLRRSRDRHGRVLVLVAGRRNHQRTIWHRLFHLERLFHHQSPGHHCRYADHWAVGRRDHSPGAPDHTSGAGLAEEGQMTSALACLRREFLARSWLWVSVVAAFFMSFHGLQLATLMVRFEAWPNYVAVHDWPANVARIVRLTPAISDMIPIILDEWLVEVGSMNYSFGRGIAEWSFVLIPGKAAVVLGIAALVATNLVLLRAAWKTCGIFAPFGSSVATGAGALIAGAAVTTITWVVCCASPAWVVGLAVMGVGVTMALALQPFGGWLLLLGLSTLVTSAILLLRQLSGRRSLDATIPMMLTPIARAPS